MADRYWFGAVGTWSTSTAVWSAATPLAFTASCSGTTLTTTGSPSLVVGMTVRNATDTSLGTITGGSGNTWTVSIGGTNASQSMIAATTGATVPTAADNAFFVASSSGAGTVAITLTGAIACLDLNVNRAVTFSGTGTPTISGSMTLAAGSSWTASGLVTFNATVSGKTVTTNGANLNCSVTFNGVGGVWTLGSALSITTTLTVSAGTLDTSASNYALSASSIVTASTASANLTLNGSTVTCNGNMTIGAASVLNAGTSQVNLTAANSTLGASTTFYNVSFTSTAGSGLTSSITNSCVFNTLAFTAPSATGLRTISIAGNQTVTTLTGSGASEIRRIFYRSTIPGTAATFTLASGQTLSNADFRDITAATSAITATSSGGNCGGNTNITFSTPKTVYWSLVAGGNWSATAWATTSGGSPAAANFPLAQDTATIVNTGLTASNTVTIDQAWNIGTIDMSGRTSAMTLASGGNLPSVHGSWSNGTGTTNTGTATITFAGRGSTQQITSNGVAFTQFIDVQNIGGTVQLVGAFTTGSTRTFTLTNGTLDLQSYTLTTGLFSSTNSNTRTIAFGTGNITVNGSGTVWTTSVTTGLTVTGTPIVNVSNNTATATTVSSGSPNEANSISFNFTTGTYSLTHSTGSKRNLNFTGFAGTVSNTAQTIYGDLTLGAAATYTGGTLGWTFAATSGSKTITTNGETMDFPLTFNGVGGSWVLQDALTMGSTRAMLHTNGTIDLNGKTFTVGASYTTQPGTKNLTFNGGAFVCPGAFSNSNSSGFTTTAGTGTGEIRMTSATAKTFAGGAAVPGVFNCTLVQAGAGALTITGGPTINDITNTTQPATVLFTSSTTTTFNNFSLSGTAGNLITIASVTSGTPATLSKASGSVTVNYCAIQDITATGGATWTAITVANGGTNTNNGGNTGWVFAAGTSVNVNVTGVGGVCSVGVGTVVADANAPPTGVSATGSVGTTTVAAKASATLTGVEATGSVGTATVSGKASVTLTGVSAAGAVGSVAVSLPTQVAVTGVEATGSAGTLDATGKAYVTLTGVAASVAIDGVGIATGGSISVDPGDVVGTGEVGTVTFNAEANTTLTGVSASGAVGTATVAAKANTTLTGVSATGSIGTATVSLPTQVAVTGVEASGAVGTVTTVSNALVNVTGVEATGSVGTVTVAAKASTTLTGVSASGAVGTVTIRSSVTVTGVSCTVTLGSVVISAGATVSLNGVQATGYIGPVLVWSVINDNQTPNWQAVDDSQSAGWSAIADGNTVVWTEIPT